MNFSAGLNRRASSPASRQPEFYTRISPGLVEPYQQICMLPYHPGTGVGSHPDHALDARQRLVKAPTAAGYPLCHKRDGYAVGRVQFSDFDNDCPLRCTKLAIDVLHLDDTITSHPRCYGQEQDILDPRHYLPLLEQRPGAFEHAKPVRRWRKEWPPVYERLLDRLQGQEQNGHGIREFIRVLELHQEHPAELVAEAVEKALEYSCAHANGVVLCLHQLLKPESAVPSLAWAEPPPWATVGEKSPDRACYDRLLERV